MISQACTPMGVVTIAVTPSTAMGFTNGIVTATTTFVMPTIPPNLAVIAVVGTTNAVWRDDGIAPTPTSGVPILVSSPPFEYSGDLSAIQFACVGATATVVAALYRVAG